MSLTVPPVWNTFLPPVIALLTFGCRVSGTARKRRNPGSQSHMPEVRPSRSCAPPIQTDQDAWPWGLRGLYRKPVDVMGQTRHLLRIDAIGVDITVLEDFPGQSPRRMARSAPGALAGHPGILSQIPFLASRHVSSAFWSFVLTRRLLAIDVRPRSSSPNPRCRKWYRNQPASPCPAGAAEPDGMNPVSGEWVRSV